MNNIYDNGVLLLGINNDIINYLNYCSKTSDMEEEIHDILEEVKEYKDDNILCINYDNGMGYTIDIWDSQDIVKVGE